MYLSCNDTVVAQFLACWLHIIHKDSYNYLNCSKRR